MTLIGVMVVTLRYFTEFGKPALQKTICGGIYAKVYCILVRVKCRRKESSRSLSHLLMSFLLSLRRRLKLTCYTCIMANSNELTSPVHVLSLTVTTLQHDRCVKGQMSK